MSFDRLAPHYDWLEALTAGQRLQRARIAWLDALDGCERVLSVGEGHGRFAHAFAKKFPQSQLTCVESSEPMLARAQRRTPDPATPIHWIHCDFFKWVPREKYDAIVTCFFLDCFSPEMLADVIAKLATCATQDAMWIVVDFTVPPSGMARWRAKAVHALMYAFFRLFTSLPARHQTEPDNILRAHGFQLEARKHYEWGLVRADVWRRTN
jgi:ubiquinone/menaquinone biosynthesis C-methylase UbiE